MSVRPDTRPGRQAPPSSVCGGPRQWSGCDPDSVPRFPSGGERLIGSPRRLAPSPSGPPRFNMDTRSDIHRPSPIRHAALKKEMDSEKEPLTCWTLFVPLCQSALPSRGEYSCPSSPGLEPGSHLSRRFHGWRRCAGRSLSPEPLFRRNDGELRTDLRRGMQWRLTPHRHRSEHRRPFPDHARGYAGRPCLASRYNPVAPGVTAPARLIASASAAPRRSSPSASPSATIISRSVTPMKPKTLRKYPSA